MDTKAFLSEEIPLFTGVLWGRVSIDAAASALRGYILQPHLIILTLWNLNS
jgi:hypothetical protein